MVMPELIFNYFILKKYNQCVERKTQHFRYFRPSFKNDERYKKKLMVKYLDANEFENEV